MQRRVLVVVGGIHGGAVPEQDLRALELTVAAGEVQGGAPLLILLVLVRAALQELLQRRLIPRPPKISTAEKVIKLFLGGRRSSGAGCF